MKRGANGNPISLILVLLSLVLFTGCEEDPSIMDEAPLVGENPPTGETPATGQPPTDEDPIAGSGNESPQPEASDTTGEEEVLDPPPAPVSEVTFAVTGPEAADGNLVIALFASYPPMGPPNAFSQIAAVEFPASLTLTVADNGNYTALVVLDRSPFNSSVQGPEDLMTTVAVTVPASGVIFADLPSETTTTPGDETGDDLPIDPPENCGTCAPGTVCSDDPAFSGACVGPPGSCGDIDPKGSCMSDTLLVYCSEEGPGGLLISLDCTELSPDNLCGDVGAGYFGCANDEDLEVPIEDPIEEEPSAEGYISSGSPWLPGALSVLTVSLDAGELGVPTALDIHAPAEAGVYPVVLFSHGFLLAKSYYSTILGTLASHGFIVVAPQLHQPGGLPIGKPSFTEDALLAAATLDWIQTSLADAIGVTPNADTIGLSGHSRGAKVSVQLFQSNGNAASAIALVDPVDGSGNGFDMEPGVTGGAFSYNAPTLTLGTGLGESSSGLFSPACAPAGYNHVQFHSAAGSPAWLFVATDFGHLDMIDASTPGCGLECSACTAGSGDKAAMREATAGLLVGFFRFTLQGDETALTWFDDLSNAPINLSAESK